MAEKFDKTDIKRSRVSIKCAMQQYCIWILFSTVTSLQEQDQIESDFPKPPSKDSC